MGTVMDTAADNNGGVNPETSDGVGDSGPLPEDTKNPRRLFQFSTWVHVGPGADDCEGVDEDKAEVNCGNSLHFHAWCRLPNQLQISTIQEKAYAAKARRARQLRDPESDAYAILESDLDEIARHGDTAKKVVIEELLSRDWWRDFGEAQQDLAEYEDDSGEKIYSTIEADQDRYAELEALAEDQRPGDEYAELERHLDRYAKALKEKHEEIIAPKRAALEAQDLNELLDTLRNDRIEKASNTAYMDAYSEWEWYFGTYKTRPPASHLGEPKFPSREALVGSAPEIIEALAEAFGDLEREQHSGNS